MTIQQVVFENFKPYYGVSEFDLSVNPEENIVLIGGRNGQGKTSFLVGLVWCVYGERISKVDKVFSKEVKNNYQRFLQSSINRRAASKDAQDFSVSITFSDVELSEVFTSNAQKSCEICLKRTFNVNTNKEDFTIFIDGEENQLVNDERGKANFIDDYLIPLEAAKFVFFDAEKISEVAEMSVKEQGKFMNEALGKMLGLSKYEELVGNLQQYRDELRKNNSKALLHSQLEAQSNKISFCESQIVIFNEKFEQSEDTMERLEREIAELEKYLAQIGAKSINIDVDALDAKKIELENQQKVIGSRLNEISEIIPFAISAGRIQELVEMLGLEQEIVAKEARLRDVKERAELFVERLFEQPIFPNEKDGGDIKIRQKAFYMDKAIDVFTKIHTETESNEIILPFRHDLSKATLEHIINVHARLKTNEDLYQSVFTDYIRLTNDISEINQQLNRARAKAEDQSVTDYKETLKSKKGDRDRAFKSKIEAESTVKQFEIQLTTAKNTYSNLLEKVDLSNKDKAVIDNIDKHMSALEDFIFAQKNSKCASLSYLVATEMRRIMHKQDLFDDVEVRILPEGGGLNVTLKKDSLEVPKEELSSGEKQIYISCLLKAILEESIVDYPVFIDTPLGRLDKDHKDSFVDKYYPFLANQVIILTTDEEVTPARKERIEHKIAKTYQLVNSDGSTQILNGYF
jgi:DNA sulfur modification protein DndD